MSSPSSSFTNPFNSPLVKPLIQGEYYIQKKLAPAESIPLLGIIPSALKAIVALAKIILGLAIVILGSPFSLFSHLICEKVECLKTLNENIFKAGAFLGGTGTQQFFLRLRNITTLGFHFYHQPTSA